MFFFYFLAYRDMMSRQLFTIMSTNYVYTILVNILYDRTCTVLHTCMQYFTQKNICFVFFLSLVLYKIQFEISFKTLKP